MYTGDFWGSSKIDIMDDINTFGKTQDQQLTKSSLGPRVECSISHKSIFSEQSFGCNFLIVNCPRKEEESPLLSLCHKFRSQKMMNIHTQNRVCATYIMGLTKILLYMIILCRMMLHILAIYLVQIFCKVTKRIRINHFCGKTFALILLEIFQLTDISPVIWSFCTTGINKSSSLPEPSFLLAEKAHIHHILVGWEADISI